MRIASSCPVDRRSSNRFPSRFFLFAILLLTNMGLLFLSQEQAAAQKQIADGGVGKKSATDAFDRFVFTWNSSDDSAAAEQRRRSRLEDLGRARVTLINRWCALSESQRTKLNLAAHGEVSRLFDRVHAARDEFLRQPFDVKSPPKFSEEHYTLRNELEYGPFRGRTILLKAVYSTLSAEQLVKYRQGDLQERRDRHRVRVASAISMLENTAELKDEQRTRLAEFLESQTPAPRIDSQYAVWVVLYQIGQIPSEKLKPFFTSQQWEAWSVRLADFQRMKPILERANLLAIEPDEDANVNPLK